MGHASTSYSEGYFNDKKKRVMAKFNGRPRVDLFLKLEYNDYLGAAAIFQNNLVLDRAEENLDSRPNFESNCTSPVDPPSPIQPNPNFNPDHPKTKPEVDPDTVSYDNW